MSEHHLRFFVQHSLWGHVSMMFERQTDIFQNYICAQIRIPNDVFPCHFILFQPFTDRKSYMFEGTDREQVEG